MRSILVIFGTRPEGIKMCPLVGELKKRRGLATSVAVTGQHRGMLHGVLDAFSVTPDYDLAVMREGQSLSEMTARMLSGLERVLREARPDLVLVHGDTTTAFAASLACFYRRIPVGHVEAGLRTYDLAAPFPEEFNRRAVALTAAHHFAPTEGARDNLLREGIAGAAITVTGNTVVDALGMTVRETYAHPLLDWGRGSRLVLLTAHRRENLGAPMEEAFRAVRRVVERRPDVKVICPVHKNPAVGEVARRVFSDCPRIFLTEPQEVVPFHNLLARCYLVLTDSGGIQEEASALGKPVLVLRSITERPEGLLTGSLRLVGTEGRQVEDAFCRLLDDADEYRRMTECANPYGDGTACRRIADVVERL